MHKGYNIHTICKVGTEFVSIWMNSSDLNVDTSANKWICGGETQGLSSCNTVFEACPTIINIDLTQSIYLNIDVIPSGFVSFCFLFFVFCFLLCVCVCVCVFVWFFFEKLKCVKQQFTKVHRSIYTYNPNLTLIFVIGMAYPLQDILLTVQIVKLTYVFCWMLGKKSKHKPKKKTKWINIC